MEQAKRQRVSTHFDGKFLRNVKPISRSVISENTIFPDEDLVHSLDCGYGILPEKSVWVQCDGDPENYNVDKTYTVCY